jgi:hypothetical protein
MKSKVFVFIAIGLALAIAPVANAAKPAGHKTTHHTAMPHKVAHQKATVHKVTHRVVKGKGCKAEFMYMKGGKCMDARAKASA